MKEFFDKPIVGVICISTGIILAIVVVVNLSLATIYFWKNVMGLQ